MRERGIVEENLSVEKEKKKREVKYSLLPEEEEEDRVCLPISERRRRLFIFFWKEVLSPQKVRETFGRRTAHFGRTHALR